jgi:hypothetical protein
MLILTTNKVEYPMNGLKILTHISIGFTLTFGALVFVQSCSNANAERYQILQCMDGDRSRQAFEDCVGE